ncbi:HpcH/HpaI aldolase family protein [Saccharopolyspora phatthalungensis]|uniref:4-hydroxy-2-oxoheptanedioate aldolase n=1 Tax=Saccharopolyspora phatthalungensis TaxID=664693 RepID=A0A840QDL5_9PSEU|nr:aldolase/citrate lyase family protein [Saccharopolyspora phatthalungensis]MBB5158097.1 4-hydroxy-2-oxoheptanedioate aldolase [Saccharopolyspora phatthalungensis]
MLRPNTVKARLARGGESYGLFCSIPSPTLVEMIGCAGYDFVILDTEHTLVDPQQLENLIRAAEAVDLVAFVRVPEADPGAILRALDAGALGVVVPHVRTRADIESAVRAARYAPEGMRSLNGGRVPGFGRIDLADYIRRANEEVMVIAMIEDAEGVDELPSILAGGGVDLVLEGAADLSQSYGVPWQTRHPQVRDALDRVHAECTTQQVPFCAIPRTREDHERWQAAGVRTFVLGEERGLAARALRAHLDDHRGNHA